MYQPECELPDKKAVGILPTLITNVEPASAIVQEEIFGPVVVAMAAIPIPQRSDCAGEQTRYELAGECVERKRDRLLDVATRIKAGLVRVNCTNYSTRRRALAATVRAAMGVKADGKDFSSTCVQSGKAKEKQLTAEKEQLAHRIRTL